MTVCTPECWTPVPCPKCGANLPPRGRSVPFEVYVRECCDDARNAAANRRHFWDAHDPDRAFVDPTGWAAHIAGCEPCAEAYGDVS